MRIKMDERIKTNNFQHQSLSAPCRPDNQANSYKRGRKRRERAGGGKKGGMTLPSY